MIDNLEQVLEAPAHPQVYMTETATNNLFNNARHQHFTRPVGKTSATNRDLLHKCLPE